MDNARFLKFVLGLNALLPLGLLLFDAAIGSLGANPVEYFLRATGVMTLVMLLVTLAVTPLRKLFGWNILIKSRRMLGLLTFLYCSIHLVTYSFFDKSGDIPAIIGDVIQRPFIAVGMAAFLILVPLALTSTNASIKKLGGKTWQRLHRLSYLVAILGVVHFWMIVKSDLFYPALFAVGLSALFAIRIYYSRATKKPLQKPGLAIRPD